MTSRRTVARRTARVALATALVASPAAVVLGTPAGDSLVSSVGATASGTQVATVEAAVALVADTPAAPSGDEVLGSGGAATATGAAGATGATASRPAISAKLLGRDTRVSRSGSRVVPAMDTARKPVAAPVVLEEKPTFVLPVSGYDLTGRFGSVSGLWSSSHTGLDFATASGTPIRSIADGTVTEAGYDGSYGYKTVVSLPDGGEVWYCHQESIGVSVGQQLSAGEVLGSVGLSGNTTGAHLHLEIRHGDTPTDPEAYLAGLGITP